MKKIYRVLRYSLLLVVACLSGAVSADSEADYKAGFDAYLIENLPAAIMSLSKAADAGHSKAQSLLGYIYDKAEENQEALKYYQLSADQGDPAGEYGLGSLYASGDGVEQDYDEASRWFLKAADQGHGPAIEVLASAYLEGGLGFKKDRKKAIELLRRGEALGYEPARQHLKRLDEEAAQQ